ncbi:MAG: anhydro-N-acetylmuramic acid kinase [Flavobacteriaceae bacterium]|nr:anhydro-N-acetylmuramic acid kinase [Flavobacteriaceae bacterium]
MSICYVKFDYNDTYDFEILKAITYKYPDTWKSSLQNAFTADEKSLKSLDIEYGNYLGNLVNRFIDKNKISNVDFIASHGHTIFHKPDKGYTLQIGNGQTIADVTRLKVICDFRTQDVNLGGQGAPLVPIGDELLFYNYDYCLNLGGFVNVSFKEDNKRIAFDICPVNIVLNHYVNKLGFAFDDKGQIASTGKINKELFERLNQLEFYHKRHPKSLGLEWVLEYVNPLIDSFNLDIKDILRTFTEHVAFQISNVIKKDSRILVTGGGAFNDFLMQRIEFYLEQKIILPSTQLVDFKEALIFAFLGLLRVENQVNCLKSVTGASKDHCSGVIFMP